MSYIHKKYVPAKMDCCFNIGRSGVAKKYTCSDCDRCIPRELVIMNEFAFILRNIKIEAKEEVCDIMSPIAKTVLSYKSSIMNNKEFIIYRNINFPDGANKPEYANIPIIMVPTPEGIAMFPHIAYMTGKFDHLNVKEFTPIPGAELDWIGRFLDDYIDVEHPLNYRFMPDITNKLYIARTLPSIKSHKERTVIMPNHGYSLWSTPIGTNGAMEQMYHEIPNYTAVAASGKPIIQKEFEHPVYLMNNLAKGCGIPYQSQLEKDFV